MTNLLTDLAALEMTPFPLQISQKIKIRTTKHIALRVFTLTNTMEIVLKPQDSLTHSIGSC